MVHFLAGSEVCRTDVYYDSVVVLLDSFAVIGIVYFKNTTKMLFLKLFLVHFLTLSFELRDHFLLILPKIT